MVVAVGTLSGGAIASHTVTLSGTTATKSSDSVSGTIVKAWITGGAHGENALITYQITTDNTPARIYERTLLLRIRER